MKQISQAGVFVFPEDKVTMRQEKYILEKLSVLKLGSGRKADKNAVLQPEEFEAFRSMLYKVSWLAHQTRPEAAGSES